MREKDLLDLVTVTTRAERSTDQIATENCRTGAGLMVQRRRAPEEAITMFIQLFVPSPANATEKSTTRTALGRHCWSVFVPSVSCLRTCQASGFVTHLTEIENISTSYSKDGRAEMKAHGPKQ